MEGIINTHQFIGNRVSFPIHPVELISLIFFLINIKTFCYPGEVYLPTS